MANLPDGIRSGVTRTSRLRNTETRKVSPVHQDASTLPSRRPQGAARFDAASPPTPVQRLAPVEKPLVRQVVFTHDALAFADERDAHRKEMQVERFGGAIGACRVSRAQQTQKPPQQSRSPCCAFVAGRSRPVQRRPDSIGLLPRKPVGNGDVKEKGNSRLFEWLGARTDRPKSAREILAELHQLL